MKYCNNKTTVNQKHAISAIPKHTAEQYLNLLENEKCFLSQLLPYHPSVKTKDRLLNGLKEYLLLVLGTEEAMKALAHGEFKQFDPLVGENACQIRAVKLALIFKKSPINFILLINAINQIKKQLEKLISEAEYLKTSDLSLNCLLERESLDIELNKNELFVIKSYLLTKVKTPRPPKLEMPLVKNEYTDTKKIKEISSVGSMFADDLVRNLREQVAASSVKFVQGISQDAKAHMVSTNFMKTYRGLQCVPCFWATRSLFQQALENQLPIILIVEQKDKNKNYETQAKTTLYFKATPKGYQVTTACTFDPNHPALILIGSSISKPNQQFDDAIWKKKLLEFCPMDLVLAYAASHRQYPDPSQEHLISDIVDTEYEYYKNKAHEWGCSLENPSRFFLTHAYCDKISNFLKNLEKSD